MRNSVKEKKLILKPFKLKFPSVYLNTKFGFNVFKFPNSFLEIIHSGLFFLFCNFSIRFHYLYIILKKNFISHYFYFFFVFSCKFFFVSLDKNFIKYLTFFIFKLVLSEFFFFKFFELNQNILKKHKKKKFFFLRSKFLSFFFFFFSFIKNFYNFKNIFFSKIFLFSKKIFYFVSTKKPFVLRFKLYEQAFFLLNLNSFFILLPMSNNLYYRFFFFFSKFLFSFKMFAIRKSSFVPFLYKLPFLVRYTSYFHLKYLRKFRTYFSKKWLGLLNQQKKQKRGNRSFRQHKRFLKIFRKKLMYYNEETQLVREL